MAGTCSTMRSRNPPGAICIGPPAQSHVRSETDDSGEGGWHHLKNLEMGNMVCHDLEELHEQFRLAVARIRRRPHLVDSFFAQAGLTIEKTCPSLRSGQ